MQQELPLNISDKKPENWFSNLLKEFSIPISPGWPDVFGEQLFEYNNINKRKSIRVLSLFSGAGGLDIAFHDAGFDIVECNEIEKEFVETLLINSKSGYKINRAKIVCEDIRNYHPELEDIDFIIGGPPCQTFSAAGARASGVNALDDKRGNLFREYIRLLKDINPRGFLFENVYRIIGAQGGKPWDVINKEFNAAGYNLFWRVLDAADYGTPQFRERLIIVGVKDKKLAYKFPSPTHGPDSKDNSKYYIAKDAIKNLMASKNKLIINGRHGHLLDQIPPGLNYSFYSEKLGYPRPIFAWRSKFSDYLYKADPDRPVRTLKAQGGQYTGPFHWENRCFSIEELKRLQTFPDKYIIFGNRQKVIHQLGNSVPPQFGRILAMSIKLQLFNSKLPVNMDLLEDDFKLGFRSRKSKLSSLYKEKAQEAIRKMGVKKTNEFNIKNDIYYVNLKEDYRLSVSKESNPSLYKITFSKHLSNWQILLGNQSDESNYSINISPKSKINKEVFENIKMVSFVKSKRSVTILWKFLEYLIQSNLSIDDLVQMFGYYQYPSKYKCEMHLSESNSNECFWIFLQNITKGLCVGKTLLLEELCFNYSLSANEMIVYLKKLKQLGYEIRNSNTNKQIPDNMILIPYLFPSLSHRSLQRFKEL